MTELIKATQIRPSTYNPRDTDPQRLHYIELSLRKLGFLLPLYMDRDGEILSGHQRHLVATEYLKTERVPVEVVRPKESMDLKIRKGLNILFNRATNDFCFNDTPRTVTEDLLNSGILEEVENLPDILAGSEDFYSCIYSKKSVEVKELIGANDFTDAADARNLVGALLRQGINMPIVVGPGLNIINGKGRVMALAERGIETAEIVPVPGERTRAAYYLLNRLSMEFNHHERYADVLRYNSFSRKRNSRQSLGRGFFFRISDKNSYGFDINLPENLKSWTGKYGNCVLNFGAGHMTESEILRKNGIYVTSFEPYVLGEKDEIDKTKSVAVMRMFLRDVAARRVWESIFCNQVFNSVPFWQDRLYLVTILAALCTKNSAVYVRATSDKCYEAPSNKGKATHRAAAISSKMIAEYEQGITLGDFTRGKPKMQKYHTLEEFGKLMQTGFFDIEVSYDKGFRDQLVAICRSPQPISLGKLREAIEFEFDLPYPDGSKMDLVAQAKEAFGKRLGVKI